jgi:hypothetical protein
MQGRYQNFIVQIRRVNYENTKLFFIYMYFLNKIYITVVVMAKLKTNGV